jgi:hypothetical protein
MRFNDRELIQISLGDAELEGRLNHRRPLSGNFSQKGNLDMILFHINAHLMCVAVEVQSQMYLAFFHFLIDFRCLCNYVTFKEKVFRFFC